MPLEAFGEVGPNYFNYLTMTNKPLVSIVLPVFKAEKYLEACLKSLLNQSYRNIEIIAVVDYLGDNSLKILRNIRKTDKRLRVYKNLQRYGLAATLNRAVSLSHGQYIAFMDSRGIAHKTRISKQIKHLLNNPKIAAVGSQIGIVNSLNRRVGESVFPISHEDVYKDLIGSESLKFESVTLDKTRLPKDILRFRKDKAYPYVYADVFMRIGIYKEIENLNEKLLLIRDLSNKKKQALNLEKKLSFIKLLFESTTIYEYKPSLRSLFSPIIKQI